MLKPPGMVRAAALLSLVACLGCSGGRDRDAGGSGHETAGVPAPHPGTSPAEAEIADDGFPAYRWSEALPLYRWSEAEGTRRVGTIPMDTDACGTESAIGPSGIALWRYRDDAGDYVFCEPWLVRPGSQGHSLGKPDVYLYTTMNWLPGKDLLAMNGGMGIRLIDPNGRIVREFPASGDPALVPVALAVDPEDGRIAVMLLAKEKLHDGDGAKEPAYALAILSQEGEVLAKVDGVSVPTFSDGFLRPLRLYWLPGKRVAFLNHRLGEGRNTLVIIDPERGTVSKRPIDADKIAGVHPTGVILFDNRRYYGPDSDGFGTLALGEEWLVSDAGFSADGRSLVAWKSRDGGGKISAIVDWDTGHRRELGAFIPLGWAPDGSLYLIPAHKPG